MTFDDHSRRAAQIVAAERARRPRWRSAPVGAPSWFSGEELDLLEPTERAKLYQELRARHRALQWFPLVVTLPSVANALRGLQSERRQLLWIAIAMGFVLVAVGAWLYRRQGIVRDARRHIRESADWPLRWQSRMSRDAV